MNSNELDQLTLVEARRLIGALELSPVELTQAVLERIERLDTQVNAFITVTAEAALEAAGKAEAALNRDAGAIGPLHGVPLSLKDLIDTSGVRTTAGSRILANRVPAGDSTVARRIRAAGGILVGKTNMHEFAYGVTSANDHYGPVRNPWNRDCVAGGSSGGSAVSVALSMALGSLGTDTGGSIRIPAALTGMVGLKPSLGRVSVAGVLPLAESFDTVGPIARSVEDAAVLLDAIAGPDAADWRTRRSPEAAAGVRFDRGVEGLRFGVPHGAFERMDARIADLVRAAVKSLEGLGAELVEIQLPDPERHEPIFRTIAGFEVFAFHETYLAEVPDQYGPDTRARIENGRAVTGEQYAAAQRELRGLKNKLAKCFDLVDLIVLPSVPVPAPGVGETHVFVEGVREEVLNALTRYTRLFSIAGLPAVSVPCGLTPERLPAGIQIAGPLFEEERVLGAAFAYQQQSGVRHKPPSLRTPGANDAADSRP